MPTKTCTLDGPLMTGYPFSTSWPTINSISSRARRETMQADSRRWTRMNSWPETQSRMSCPSIRIRNWPRSQSQKSSLLPFPPSSTMPRIPLGWAPIRWFPLRPIMSFSTRMLAATWCSSCTVKTFRFRQSRWKATTARNWRAKQLLRCRRMERLLRWWRRMPRTRLPWFAIPPWHWAPRKKKPLSSGLLCRRLHSKRVSQLPWIPSFKNQHPRVLTSIGTIYPRCRR